MGIGLFVVLVTVDFDLTFVERVETEFLKDSASDEESGGVSGRVIGQTNGDSVTGELMRVGGADNNVTDQTSIGNLGDDILIGDADNESVLWSVVLILVLDTKTLSGEVVSLAFASSSKLDLVSLEVGLVLLDGHEGLLSSSSFLCHFD